MRDRVEDDQVQWQSDCRFCMRQEDTEFWRRTLVRTVFAYVEAHTAIFRRLVLEMYARSECPVIPLTKIALLQDCEYQPDDVGKVKRQSLKITTSKQIALTLRTLAEVVGKDEDYIRDRVFGVNEWRSLKEAMKVRDRLTHPKKYGDLSVTNNEKEQCVSAYKWLGRITGEILREISRAEEPIKYFYSENDQGFLINFC